MAGNPDSLAALIEKSRPGIIDAAQSLQEEAKKMSNSRKMKLATGFTLIIGNVLDVYPPQHLLTLR